MAKQILILLAVMLASTANAATFADKYIDKPTSYKDLKIILAGDVTSADSDLFSGAGEYAEAVGLDVSEQRHSASVKLQSADAVLTRAGNHLMLLSRLVSQCERQGT